MHESFSNAQVSEILVLESDRLRAAVLAQTISTVFPTARVYCESEPASAAAVLGEHCIQLFVVAVRGFDFNITTLLGVWAEHDADSTRVLIVTAETHSTAIAALRKLPISGIFDCSSGDLLELELACRTVGADGTYRGSAEKPPLVPVITASEL